MAVAAAAAVLAHVDRDMRAVRAGPQRCSSGGGAAAETAPARALLPARARARCPEDGTRMSYRGGRRPLARSSSTAVAIDFRAAAAAHKLAEACGCGAEDDASVRTALTQGTLMVPHALAYGNDDARPR